MGKSIEEVLREAEEQNRQENMKKATDWMDYIRRLSLFSSPSEVYNNLEIYDKQHLDEVFNESSSLIDFDNKNVCMRVENDDPVSLLFKTRFANPDKLVCILNPGSFNNPAVGFALGVMDTEAILCHQSNLFEFLSLGQYTTANHHILGKYSDAMIDYNHNYYKQNRDIANSGDVYDIPYRFLYTKNVTFIQHSIIPYFKSEVADVITCSPIRKDDLKQPSDKLKALAIMGKAIQCAIITAYNRGCRIMILTEFGDELKYGWDLYETCGMMIKHVNALNLPDMQYLFAIPKVGKKGTEKYNIFEKNVLRCSL
ncbi:MAG: hypothetical protein IKR19_08035 [Acholeplasmatales bacterium]|nr:hypothetical protein [Acholeplasmatales bacterium]